MRQERLYTIVGFFVIGALGLIILGAVFLYDAYIHRQVDTYVMFFKGSLTGLETTAPVKFRGIKIGEVSRIEVTENRVMNRVDIPVYVQFFVEKSFGLRDNPIQRLINNNYVASISSPNLLTGRSDIELINVPSTVRLKKRYFRQHPIFPTYHLPLKYVTLNETLDMVKKTLKDIQAFVNSKDLQLTIDSIKKTAQSFERLANNWNQKTPFIVNSFDSIKKTAQSIESLANSLDQKTPQVVNSLNRSLDNISDAATSTRNLTDYLSRYPESLLRGKS